MENQLQEFLTNVGKGNINAITAAQKLLANGAADITLAMESKRVMPDRMESPPRDHTFHDADGFARYLAANKTEGLVVLIDAANQQAEAVLDDRAKTQFEKISFVPVLHPQFVMLQKTLLGGKMLLKSFAEAIMRNREVIVGADGATGQAGRDLAMLMKQITVSNAVSIEEGVGDGAINGVMIETKVKAGTASAKVSLPETLKVKLPIYLNTEPRQFELAVTVLPESADRVSVVVDAPELPVLMHTLFEEMLVDVKGIPGAFVSYGVIEYGSWNYNE